MMYNKLLEDCFFFIHHGGVLSEKQPDCVCFKSNLSGRGGAIVFSIQCTKGVITRACFKAQGDPYMIAALEWICRQLEGEPLSLHPRLSYQYLISRLDIPEKQYSIALRVEDIYIETIDKMKKKLRGDTS